MTFFFFYFALTFFFLSLPVERDGHQSEDARCNCDVGHEVVHRAVESPEWPVTGCQIVERNNKVEWWNISLLGERLYSVQYILLHD